MHNPKTNFINITKKMLNFCAAFPAAFFSLGVIFAPYLILILASALFSSCADTFLPALEVRSIDYDSEKISVAFSETPEPSSFQKGFSMTEDNASVKGSFSFSGKTVYFFPDYGIQENYDYKIVLTTQIEDTDGKSLMHDVTYNFTTRKDSVNPRLVNQFPANQEYIDMQLNQLFFYFSKPIDTQSFLSSVSISPDFQYFCTFSDDDKSAAIIPSENLKKNTRYTISISENLQDKNRNPLVRPINTVFYYLMDNLAPTLSINYLSPDGSENFTLHESATNEKLSSDGKFELVFSKKIKIETLAGYIAVTPPVTYSVTQDKENQDKATIEFENPEWSKTYTVRIKNGISDLSENKTECEYIYDLIFNNESKRPLEFDSVFFQTSQNDFSEFSESSNYSDLPLDSIYFAKNAEIPAALYMIFYSSKNAQKLDFYSVLENFSISSTNGCCSVELKSASVISENDFSLLPACMQERLNNSSASGNSGKAQIIKFNMEITNKTNSGLVFLDIPKEIKDSLGNSLKESIRLSLNK